MTHKPDDPDQLKRFKEMAREVEVDETPGALDRAFKKVVVPKTDTIKSKVIEGEFPIRLTSRL